MKYKTQTELNLNKIIVEPNEILALTTYIPTSQKYFDHISIFTKIIKEKIWTFSVHIKVEGNKAKSIVKVTDFTRKSNDPDDPYRTYSGGDNIEWEIDTENNIIYYLQEIAANAINHYINTSM